MTKHTPGQWKVSPTEIQTVIGCDHVVAKALYWSGSENVTEVVANARLIAASPDLLECLEEAIRGIEWWVEMYPEMDSEADYEFLIKARAAIAKAKGE